MRVQVPVTAKTRQRRRRRRLYTLLVYIIMVFGLAWFFSESQGTTTVIFVRHADTDTAMGSATENTPLSRAGLARAELLADYLEHVDVTGGPDAIYASSAKRTQQTAEPLAQRLGIEIEIEDPYDVVNFMEEVLEQHKREVVLIVTHKDAIAPLVEELHGSKNLAPIGPDEFDKVFIVSIPWFGKVKTLQVKYGEPPAL
jgi:broad specificity phosphatase PhoE